MGQKDLRYGDQLLPKTLWTNTVPPQVLNIVSVMQLVTGLGLLLAVGQTISQGE